MPTPRVPFIDLEPVTALVSEAAQAAWRSAVERTEFVGGSAVAELEAALARQLGVEHVVCCSSGTDALIVGLRALGIGPESRVALPNLTFWATYEAVALAGAAATLIDVDSTHLQLDLEELVAAHERFRFDAAILVHLMGWATPELEQLRAFCRERGIKLLEDGAQSFGVKVAGKSVYAGAELSTLSFYPAKVLGGCMDGGALLTDDANLAALVRKLCNHGRSGHFSHSHVGQSARMGGLQAAWLGEMLRHGEAIVAERARWEAAYRGFFRNGGFSVQALGPPDGVDGNGYLSVCLLPGPDREVAATQLQDAGVATGWVYPQTISQQPPAVGAQRVSELQRSRDFCRRVINLPLYYGMTEAQFDCVCASCARLFA